MAPMLNIRISGLLKLVSPLVFRASNARASGDSLAWFSIYRDRHSHVLSTSFPSEAT